MHTRISEDFRSALITHSLHRAFCKSLEFISGKQRETRHTNNKESLGCK